MLFSWAYANRGVDNSITLYQTSFKKKSITQGLGKKLRESYSLPYDSEDHWKMTSAQVVETSVTNNSSFQNYSDPDDHTIRTSLRYAMKITCHR